MQLLNLNKNAKILLVVSIIILLVNLMVFIFRNHIETSVVVLVVFITPAAWMAMYFVSNLLIKDRSDNLDR